MLLNEEQLAEIGRTMLGNSIQQIRTNMSAIRTFALKENPTKAEEEALARMAFALHALCALVHPHIDAVAELAPDILEILEGIISRMRKDGILICDCDKCKEIN